MQATRCTQLYVYGNPESTSPGWLSKKDATSSRVILPQALAYAAGNQTAGEVGCWKLA
jgi:hypothetical protein